MTRVRRLVEVYLSRLAEQDPDAFADADEQLAFFLNAYNTIAVHQVLLHYPLRSLREVGGAFSRPYPIGRRNLSLLALEAGTLRAFGDPRVHAAITPAALGAAALGGRAFEGAELQQQLDAAARGLLADARRGAGYDAQTDTLWLPAALRRYAVDWIDARRGPAALRALLGRVQPAAMLPALAPLLPSTVAVQLGPGTRVRFAPYAWALNEIRPEARGTRQSDIVSPKM